MPLKRRGFPYVLLTLRGLNVDSRMWFKIPTGEGDLDSAALTDEEWRRIEPLVPGKKGDKGRHGADNRLFVDAVLWLVRAGAPWRDLPEEFGKWNSAFKRFRRWARKGVWKRLFTELGEHPDLEYLIIDSTIVRAHQHAAGAQKGGPKMRRSGVRAAV
jgi:transposase